MARRAAIAGRLLYGSLFLIVVPVALVLWARATEDGVPLPALHRRTPGLVLMAAGFAAMVAGWLAIIRRGSGLPMNAFPPSRLVTTGVYGWVRNPIYIGFGTLTFGVAIATGSASGLWLVAPVVCLAMAALVLAYERPDLHRRFGDDALYRPRIALPRGDGPPTGWERLSVFVLVFGPWLVAYYGVQYLGVPKDAFSVGLAFEQTLPVLQWTEAAYAAVYLFVLATPLLIATRSDLRRFAFAGLLGTAVVTLLWISIPVAVSYRPFEATNPLGRLLAYERDSANGMASFPAFHVIWTLIAADAWSRFRWPRPRWVWNGAVWSLAGLMSLSCVTTGMHASLDVVAAALLFIPIHDPVATWEQTRSAAERIANSWQEWQFGRVRLISHGLYAALAAALGFGLAGAAAGADSFGTMMLLGVCSLAGAGLWAQALEGSSKLLRPFGYYGAVLGLLIGAVIAWGIGADVLLLLGAWAVAAPWIQAIGRLRCLVQGCCHGGPAPACIGIRYFHSRSRATQLSDLAAVPLHPTPLYSILANGVTGLLLIRLWTVGAAPALVLGTYLMLNALARFVEESFRAEPQTPIVRGLHIYHWFALLAFAMGVVATSLPSVTPAVPFPELHPWLLPAALGFGLLAGFSMGVDFPGSDRRFSRLAAADGPVGLIGATTGSRRSPR